MMLLERRDGPMREEEGRATARAAVEDVGGSTAPSILACGLRVFHFWRSPQQSNAVSARWGCVGSNFVRKDRRVGSIPSELHVGPRTSRDET